jgi:hypothetical protein
MAMSLVPQHSLDEITVDNSALEQALEQREKRKASAGAARKAYKEAHDRAAVIVGELDLADGDAVRVGRFRISRRATVGRQVSFETSPSSRLTISVVEP